jgi:hypothetical protein
VEKKMEIMQHVLKMQQISLLPKYIKLISRGHLNIIGYVGHGYPQLEMDITCNKHVVLLLKVLLVILKTLCSK